jgi:hypothetical protein
MPRRAAAPGSAASGISGVRISDIRTMRADVAGMSELRTAAGRDPIDPRWVRVTYDIASGEVYGAVVGGYRLARELSDPAVVRRIKDLNAAPEWLRALIEEQAP